MNIELGDDTASFYRVYQKDGVNQTALVLLNKGDSAAVFDNIRWLDEGAWRDAISGDVMEIDARSVAIEVAAHGVRVLLSDEPVSNPELLAELARLQAI